MRNGETLSTMGMGVTITSICPNVGGERMGGGSFPGSLPLGWLLQFLTARGICGQLDDLELCYGVRDAQGGLELLRIGGS